MSKTILITGSTDGIGKIAALKLAKEGHHVYLHGRNPQKLSAVISEIKEVSKNDNIGGFVADLSDLNDVRQMAEKVKMTLPRIDVLINNAGVFKSPNSTNKDGIDLRMMVNYLAPYLLTKELLPLIKGSEDLRIINLSSAAQASVSMDLLQGKTQGSENNTYAQSKLALTMWSFDLAKVLNHINVIALNPGSLLNTRMVQEAYGKYWSSADKGANIIYDLAVANKYANDTAKYFDNDRGSFGPAHEDAYDAAKIKQLIAVTEGLIK